MDFPDALPAEPPEPLAYGLQRFPHLHRLKYRQVSLRDFPALAVLTGDTAARAGRHRPGIAFRADDGVFRAFGRGVRGGGHLIYFIKIYSKCQLVSAISFQRVYNRSYF